MVLEERLIDNTHLNTWRVGRLFVLYLNLYNLYLGRGLKGDNVYTFNAAYTSLMSRSLPEKYDGLERIDPRFRDFYKSTFIRLVCK